MTRIKLQPRSIETKADYINANRVVLPLESGAVTRSILAQGPLPQTQ